MDLEVVRESWEMQGEAPEGVDDACAQVHHAVARIAALARAALGDEGAQLEWLDEARAFATPVIPGSQPFRLALAPSHLRLLVTDANGEALQQLALDGKTAAAAAQWLAEQAAAHGASLGGGGEVPIPYRLPEHSVGRGEPFALRSEAAFEDVTRSYANAVRALLCAKALIQADQPVRIDPETLHVTCGTAFDGSSSVGLGYSPGDEECNEPYYYAKPCPAPKYEEDALPELEGGGEWKTSGAWFGGVLRRAEWIWYDAEQLQAGAVASFLDSAVDASRDLFHG